MNRRDFFRRTTAVAAVPVAAAVGGAIPFVVEPTATLNDALIAEYVKCWERYAAAIDRQHLRTQEIIEALRCAGSISSELAAGAMSAVHVIAGVA